MFADKARSLPKRGLPEECSSVISSGLNANIRLGWKSLAGRNTLAYYKYS
jgi:hypothetical protein